MPKLHHVSLALIKSFILHARVISLTRRLKKVKPKLEAFISLAKRNNSRFRSVRLVRAKLRCGPEFAARALLVARLYGKIDSGYTRLLKLGKRRGDGAHMSIMLPSTRLPLAYCD
ncbi:putative 50S ribosomal subunit protein L17 [Candidatus Hodgkinia cicadicola]|nr:putative 50S ribosomal subunit protein L17 [Candidatus Hodgkinia cicadicola]